MAVTELPVSYSYVGDGANKIFAYPSYFMAQADLVVEVTDLAGAVTTKVLTTDYSITGATDAYGAYSGGGSLVFVAAPGAGFTVSITRRTPITQPVSYQPNDAFPATTHEHALDRQTLILQEILASISR